MHSKPIVSLVAKSGNQVGSDSCIPELFLDSAISAWLGKPERVILDVTTTSRSGAEWRMLGQELISELMNLGQQIGVCIDGTFPIHLCLDVARSMFATTVPLFLQLTQLNRPLPSKMGSVQNSTWFSFQSTESGSWIKTIWTSLDSQWFNHGCDMMAAIYSRDVLAHRQWNDPVTVQLFGRTLEDAEAWLVPLEGNLGFLVGIRVELQTRCPLLSL